MFPVVIIIFAYAESRTIGGCRLVLNSVRRAKVLVSTRFNASPQEEVVPVAYRLIS